ncbi:MAG: hypothetical protein E6G56_09075 [Actinobacteria bacterium]|nr:MAG: hypothetical protein E6G56_09075 [Actinomycetota bacterium]
MAEVLAEPDLALQLAPEPQATRVARNAVRQLNKPSPDLRDVIGLLTTTLVTRARRVSGADDLIDLRVWMPRRVVRIELRCAGELLPQPAGEPAPAAVRAAESELELVDGLADRWEVEHEGERSLIWLEIDRVKSSAGERPDSAGDRGGRAAQGR